MTIKEILEKIDRKKPNTIDTKDKYDWLNEIDGMIHERIFSRAEDYTAEFTPYEDGTDLETPLLIPAPYTDMYYYFISAKIDADNGEFTSYNNNMTLYNNMYEDFAAFYRRNHIPRGY